MTFAVQNAIPHVDELVREYLVFRGFPKALAAFDSDKRTDRLKGFQVPPFLCWHATTAAAVRA
jgi:predicted AAA+ superfamily ATPase